MSLMAASVYLLTQREERKYNSSEIKTSTIYCRYFGLKNKPSMGAKRDLARGGGG